MTDILTSSDYPDIRVKLGVTVDDLSDSDIGSIALLPITEALVERAVPTWSTIMGGPSGANKTFLRAATLCLCAALAIDGLEMKRSQAFRLGDYSESETKADWEKLRCDLLDESKSYMLLINTGVPIARRTIFAAAGPTAAGTTWPMFIEQWFRRLAPLVAGWIVDGGQRFHGWENMP